MKRIFAFGLLSLVLLAASEARAQQLAVLVGQYFGQSITGAPAMICIYSVAGRTFEIATRGVCAPSIMVQ